MVFAKRRIGETGLSVTVFGVGGGPFGNLMRPTSDDDARATLHAAWESGFRYFDTAPVYGFGLSERRVGEAFRALPRSEAVISTKVGRLLRPDPGWHPFRTMFPDAAPFRPDYDYSYDAVMRSYEDSRQRLGLERVDILYMHDISAETHGEALPSLFKTAMDGGYRAMDELRRNGDVKAIGLGVNEWEACDAAMDHGRWDVFLLAGRYTLLEQGPLDTFLPRCQRENVSVVIGGPLNSGILASGAVEGATYNYEPASPEILERVRGIEAVCRAHGVPIAAAAFQFPLTHPSVVSVIPGMASRAQLEWNVERMTQPIPAALWTDLKAQGLVRADAPTPAATSIGVLDGKPAAPRPSAGSAEDLRRPVPAADANASTGLTRLHVGRRLSQIVIHGDTIYLTGCIAERTKGRSVREQMHEILATIDRALAEAGSDKTRILTASIYLADIATYTEMNAAWDAWVPEGHTPARATFQSKLPISATSVMVACTAARGEG